MIRIHPGAEVSPEAEIGDETLIWRNVQIREQARLGRNCIVGQSAYIDFAVVIGDNVKIQNNVSVYTGVILEDDVFCGPSMVFTNVINPRSHVARKDEYRQTLVRRGASIGANCTVVCGTTIGRYAFVGAGAVVTKDIPDYALVYGNPARIHGWMCACGVALRFPSGDGTASCAACGGAYEKSGNSVKPLAEATASQSGATGALHTTVKGKSQ